MQPLPSAPPGHKGMGKGRKGLSVPGFLSPALVERTAQTPAHALPEEETACLQTLNATPADRPAVPRPGSQCQPFPGNTACEADFWSPREKLPRCREAGGPSGDRGRAKRGATTEAEEAERVPPHHAKRKSGGGRDKGKTHHFPEFPGCSRAVTKRSLLQ